jgi:hypothetical protein
MVPAAHQSDVHSSAKFSQDAQHLEHNYKVLVSLSVNLMLDSILQVLLEKHHSTCAKLSGAHHHLLNQELVPWTRKQQLGYSVAVLEDNLNAIHLWFVIPATLLFLLIHECCLQVH